MKCVRMMKGSEPDQCFAVVPLTLGRDAHSNIVYMKVILLLQSCCLLMSDASVARRCILVWNGGSAVTLCAECTFGFQLVRRLRACWDVSAIEMSVDAALTQNHSGKEADGYRSKPPRERS